MRFYKGAELDKQIYKEGESTWGCKSGVLDVEDVKEWIGEIIHKIETTDWEDDSDIINLIEEDAGDKLLNNFAKEGLSE